MNQQGLLWLGTNGGGVQYFDPHSPFKYYHHQPHDTYSLSNNSVRSILTDKRGNLWIGGYGGLDRFNQTQHSVQHYNAQNTIAGGLFNPNVYCLVFDPIAICGSGLRVAVFTAWIMAQIKFINLILRLNEYPSNQK